MKAELGNNNLKLTVYPPNKESKERILGLHTLPATFVQKFNVSRLYNWNWLYYLSGKVAPRTNHVFDPFAIGPWNQWNVNTTWSFSHRVSSGLMGRFIRSPPWNSWSALFTLPRTTFTSSSRYLQHYMSKLPTCFSQMKMPQKSWAWWSVDSLSVALTAMNIPSPNSVISTERANVSHSAPSTKMTTPSTRCVYSQKRFLMLESSSVDGVAKQPKQPIVELRWQVTVTMRLLWIELFRYETGKAFKHQLKIEMKARTPRKTHTAELSIQGQCDQHMQHCKAVLNVKRSPLESESENW